MSIGALVYLVRPRDSKAAFVFCFVQWQATGWEWEESPEVHSIHSRGSGTDAGWIFWG